jgi:HAD superfamily hydrolase (TIGR01509 family)
MISTAIFDLDGLLTDTERLHREAYRTTLGRHGFSLDDVTYDEHWIRAGKGIGDLIRERKLAFDPDALRAEKAAEYDRLVRSSVQPMPGAREILARLHGRKTLALASSSYPDAVEAVLETVGIRHYFTFVANSLAVKRVKPWPDLFLQVAAGLRVEPRCCVVLEDSEKGILAAYAAGMTSIAVPNEYTRQHDFSKATRVVSSLDEVSLEMIESLGQGNGEG